ncbi:MAG TPA: LytTR family DNA-binding domain-containing protein [Ramlibacter sp.]|nr:LytTR family DNA-binding domain-containing protein [Ramlibacter sp.]
MSQAPIDWLARYRPWQRQAETGFWVAVLGVQLLFNSVVTWVDLRRFEPSFPYWPPLVWELSSALVVGALIPGLAAFERRFPLRWDTWRRSVPLHVLGSVVFCVIHVLGMVLLRKAAYAALGERYEVRSWATTFGYEYLKDVRSYLLILAALWSYRFVLLRLQGEARVLDAPEPAPQEAQPATPSAARPERFLVRKLRKEFLIAAGDIEWLQAQGNYVGLHVNGHDYLLRSTLVDFLEQLDPARFARVHRSYAVNLDRVAEIEPLEAGDARLKMKDGTQLPCSRRYREALGKA